VVALKGLGSPTAMALMAFRNREAARAVDGGAESQMTRSGIHGFVYCIDPV
jgi:hypothetical protein